MISAASRVLIGDNIKRVMEMINDQELVW